MKRWIIAVLLSLGLGFWLGRQTLDEIVETFFPGTPREVYVERLVDSGLGESALVRLWRRVGEDALREAPLITAPFRESGYLDPTRPEAVAYRFRTRAGQRLAVDLRMDPPSNALLFVELFRIPADSADAPVHVLSADSGTVAFDYEPRRDAEYIVRVQPELLRGGRYTLTAEVGPTLAFPVSGRNVDAIQSFWGDPRDGGARDHHGVDIFAPRGTPVIAAAEGRVSSVRTTPIGGHVVWLRDERRGQSIYYAHLERQLVERGAMVRPGDTLGLVGNSGNARSTPPHLHFGIYRRGQGPLDPLPFLAPPSAPVRDPVVPLEDIGGVRRVAASGVRLRVSPTTDATALAELEEDAPVDVRGAVGEWYRVRLPDGRTGFVAGRLTEPVSPIRTAALTDPAALRDRPDSAAVEILRLPAGERIEVLGGANGHLYVRARGRTAWVSRAAAP